MSDRWEWVSISAVSVSRGPASSTDVQRSKSALEQLSPIIHRHACINITVLTHTHTLFLHAPIDTLTCISHSLSLPISNRILLINTILLYVIISTSLLSTHIWQEPLVICHKLPSDLPLRKLPNDVPSWGDDSVSGGRVRPAPHRGSKHFQCGANACISD